MSGAYALLFTFIIYADALDFIPMINYWDEALTIVIVVIQMFKLIMHGKMKWRKEKIGNYVLLFSVLAIGIIGNLLHPGIQSSSEAIWKDVIAFLKFPLLMIVLFDKTNNYYIRHREQIVRKVGIICRLTIIAAVALAIVGYFINIGVYTEEARFFRCYQFVFSHPTFMVANLVFCVAMLVMENKKKNKWYIYTTCVLLFLSQRFKAYAIIAIIVLLMLLKDGTLNKLFSFKWKTKFRAKYIVPAVTVVGVIVFFVFRNRFATYLSWGMTSARLALIVVCVRIAVDFFPIGSGFGTFASFLSGKYYSGIYYMYGLSNVYGLRIDQYNFISDTFWPWVIGQFGFVATVLYIRLYVKLIKNQLATLTVRNHLLAFIIVWMYALLASMMEAFFTNATGVALAVILMIYIGKDASVLPEKIISESNK